MNKIDIASFGDSTNVAKIKICDQAERTDISSYFHHPLSILLYLMQAGLGD